MIYLLLSYFTAGHLLKEEMTSRVVREAVCVGEMPVLRAPTSPLTLRTKLEEELKVERFNKI